MKERGLVLAVLEEAESLTVAAVCERRRCETTAFELGLGATFRAEAAIFGGSEVERSERNDSESKEDSYGIF